MIKNLAIREALNFNYQKTKIKNNEILFEIKDNNLNIIENKCYSLFAQHRFCPVINFINQKIDLKGLNFKFVFYFGDLINNDENNKRSPRLVFSKVKNDNQILFPSFTSFSIYNQLFEQVDKFDINFSDKKNKLCFAGTSTGKGIGRLEDSTRFQYCINTYLNHVSHLIPESTKDNIQLSECFFPKDKQNKLTIKEQLQYKYLISIDGHSTSFDRPVWQMYSNSLAIKIRDFRNNFVEWFYPLIRGWPEINIEDIDNYYNFLQNEPKYVENLICQQRNFVTTNLLESNIIEYVTTLFNTINSIASTK